MATTKPARADCKPGLAELHCALTASFAKAAVGGQEVSHSELIPAKPQVWSRHQTPHSTGSPPPLLEFFEWRGSSSLGPDSRSLPRSSTPAILPGWIKH